METEENVIIPEKWAVERTLEANEIIIPWYKENNLGSGYSTTIKYGYLHSHDYGFNGHSGSGHYCADDRLHPEHTLISLDFFKKYILKEAEDNSYLVNIL